MKLKMKKTVCLLLTLLLVFALGCALAAGETTTLLVYMCGTDLQEDACESISSCWPAARRNGRWIS